MSACISVHGEYSDHILDDLHTCTRCSVLDEDALRAELARLRELSIDREALGRAACEVIGNIKATVAMPEATGTLANRLVVIVDQLHGDWTSRGYQIAELNSSNASLIRRVGDLENQLAEANDRAEAANNLHANAERMLTEARTKLAEANEDVWQLTLRVVAQGAVVAAAKAWRNDGEYSAATRVALVAAVDAYDAAGKGETAQDPWATNDVYTVPCPTCGRMASAYCVNFQGREVYPAHAARYRRLTEPMDVPIDDTPQAEQGGTDGGKRCFQCGAPIEWRDDIDWWVHVDAGNDTHMPLNPRGRRADSPAGKGETNDATASLAVTSRGLAIYAVLSDVIDERFRQDAKWGQSNHPDGTGPDWRLFGSSGVDWQRAVDTALDQATRSGFALDTGGDIREIQAPGATWMLIALKQIFGVFVETDPATIRSKLIRVAAVAVAWAEAIDRRADSRVGQTGGED